MRPEASWTRLAWSWAAPGLLGIVVLVSGCARKNPAITTTALCAPPVAGPSSWREVPVPKSALKVRLPQSYSLKGGTWQTEEASIAFNWHPHQPPEHEDPGQGGPHAPECSVSLADRTVWLKRWIAISPSGAPYYITVATWEEVPGTDIEITTSARDTYQQREQVKVIYSLHA
jgi:hypothetical protein